MALTLPSRASSLNDGFNVSVEYLSGVGYILAYSTKNSVYLRVLNANDFDPLTEHVSGEEKKYPLGISANSLSLSVNGANLIVLVGDGVTYKRLTISPITWLLLSEETLAIGISSLSQEQDTLYYTTDRLEIQQQVGNASPTLSTSSNSAVHSFIDTDKDGFNIDFVSSYFLHQGVVLVPTADVNVTFQLTTDTQGQSMLDSVGGAVMSSNQGFNGYLCLYNEGITTSDVVIPYPASFTLEFIGNITLKRRETTLFSSPTFSVSVHPNHILVKVGSSCYLAASNTIRSGENRVALEYTQGVASSLKVFIGGELIIGNWISGTGNESITNDVVSVHMANGDKIRGLSMHNILKGNQWHTDRAFGSIN